MGRRPTSSSRFNERIIHVTLRIRMTPDIPRRKRNSLGVTSGLSLSEYLHLLFFVNETLPRSGKMTDTEIMRQVDIEYPHSKFLTYQDDPKSHNTLGKFRGYYNKGRLIRGVKPLLISHRWTVDGKIATSKGMPLSDQGLHDRLLRDAELLASYGSPLLHRKHDGTLKADRYSKVAIAGLGTIWPDDLTPEARVALRRVKAKALSEQKQRKQIKRAVKRVAASKKRKQSKEETTTHTTSEISVEPASIASDLSSPGTDPAPSVHLDEADCPPASDTRLTPETSA